MLHEKSCGAAIYALRDGGRLWLVERMQKGHTSLCKGHVEAGETEHETAAREIREETGLAVAFRDGFRQTIEYSPCEGCRKQVVFFLAQAESMDAVPQPEEVAAVQWLPLGEAMAALTYPDDRRVLAAAASFLSGRRRLDDMV